MSGIVFPFPLRGQPWTRADEQLPSRQQLPGQQMRRLNRETTLSREYVFQRGAAVGIGRDENKR